ncbi:hypothetical protein H3C61_00465 [Candidatus Gracilibacteria bacterium]|nr:hypothetical protein [Candidatus Gracilibacteria bacterium]
MSNLEVLGLEQFDTNKDKVLSLQEVENIFASGQGETFKKMLNRTPDNPKDKEILDTAFSKIADDFKRFIIDGGTIDKTNIGTTYVVQMIGVVRGTYSKDNFDGKWGADTEKIFQTSFSPEERSKLKIIGEVNVGPHKQLKETVQANQTEKVMESENKIAVVLRERLEKLGVSPELMTQISENADKFKKVFPEIDLYLSQGKIGEARTFLEKNSDRLKDIKDEKLTQIFQVIIDALKIAEIVDNPEKVKLLKAKQKVQIVLDNFEVINSDDSIIWLKNEKSLYYDFQAKIEKIIQNPELTPKELISQIKKETSNFEEEVRIFVYKQNPLPKGDPRYDIHYRDTVMINDKHIARIQARFTKFGQVLDKVSNASNLNSSEQIATLSLNSFVDTKNDSPLTNKDLRFASKEMTANLREKMRNNFRTLYDVEFNTEVSNKYSKEQLKQKVEEAKQEITKANPNIKGKELELRALYYTQKQLEQEFEENIFTKLSKNPNIAGEQKQELNKYIELFDPKNEFFNIGIDGKNNILEETISLPLTAFAIGRISKVLFGATQATLKGAFAVDFIEGAGFELITRLRQNRFDMSSYTTKDFVIGSTIGAALFGVMKIDKIPLKGGGEIPLKFSADTLKNRGANHLIEAGMFTGIEWIGTYLGYDQNIFAGEQAEKILNNIGILYLVKLGYSPKELGGVLPQKAQEMRETSQVIRGKESPAKMKGVGATSGDGGVSIGIKDALGGNIENVMNGFRGTDNQINAEFQRLLQSSKDSGTLRLEASGLIKNVVETRVRELELQGVRVNTQAELDYIATYKLQRIAEFNRLIQEKESLGKIPKEIDMKLEGFDKGKDLTWKLRLENPDRMDRILGEALERFKREKERRDKNRNKLITK